MGKNNDFSRFPKHVQNLLKAMSEDVHEGEHLTCEPPEWLREQRERQNRDNIGDWMRTERVLFDGNSSMFRSIGDIALMIFTFGLILPILAWRSMSTRYRVTNHRITVESGAFNKTVNVIELSGVDDFIVRIPMGMDLLDIGDLDIVSTNPTKPKITLHGVSFPRKMYEDLRESAFRVQSTLNVRRYHEL